VVAKGILAAVGVVALFVGIWGAGLAFTYFTADVRGAVSANEQIKSGPNRIVQYDSFFNACASVQHLKAAVRSTRDAMARATSEREQERLSSTLAGQEQLLAGAVARYNADATKNYTDGQFRDSDLPYQLFVEGETTCAY